MVNKIYINILAKISVPFFLKKIARIKPINRYRKNANAPVL